MEIADLGFDVKRKDDYKLNYTLETLENKHSVAFWIIFTSAKLKYRTSLFLTKSSNLNPLHYFPPYPQDLLLAYPLKCNNRSYQFRAY